VGTWFALGKHFIYAHYSEALLSDAAAAVGHESLPFYTADGDIMRSSATAKVKGPRKGRKGFHDFSSLKNASNQFEIVTETLKRTAELATSG
jgi:hypothetical protein